MLTPKTMFKGRPIALLSIVLLLVLAGGAYWLLTPGSSVGAGKPPAGAAGDPSAKPPAAPPAAPPGGGFAMPVEAVKVKIDAAQRQVLAIGSVRSFESIIVRPEFPGRVAEFNFKEGQRVTKDAVLVRMDDSVEKAQLVQAQAQLDLSKSNYARAQTLAARDAGSIKSVDEARAKLKNDEAAVDLAQTRLDKLTLTAPFDGLVGLRKASVGDYLNTGAEIVNLEQIDPLKIDFRVPELFLSAVKIGQTIAVTVDAIPGRNFTGEVYAINPLIDEAGRSIVIRARISNGEDLLRPGLFARVTLALNTNPNAVFVPEQAIVPIGDKTFVYRVVEGKVVNTPVKTGMRRGGEVEIAEGLHEGDMVITAGHLKVRDGSPVMVVNPPGQNAPAPAPAPAPALAPK